MPTFATTNITSDRAEIAVVDCNQFGGISILKIECFKLKNSPDLKTGENNSDDETVVDTPDSSSASPNVDPAQSVNNSDEKQFTEIETLSQIPLHRLEQDTGRIFESVTGILPRTDVLYETLSLPFNTPKKIAQVMPLQVQDLVPFDVDDFILDYIPITADSEVTNSYPVISAIAPKSSIRQAIDQITTLGIPPTALHSMSSLLTNCVAFESLSFQLGKDYSVAYFDEDGCSIASVANNSIVDLRDIYAPLPAHSALMLSGLRTYLASLEDKFSDSAHNLFMIGSKEDATQLQKHLPGFSVKFIDLKDYVEIDSATGADPNQLAWAIGAANYLNSSHAHSINFRKNEFEYKPFWRNLMNSFRDEIHYVLGAIAMFIIWILQSLYTSHADVSSLDQHIRSEVSKVLSGEVIPFRQEVEFVSDKIVELEDQLRSMGNLSSVSPLDIMKSLSTAVPPELDIAIDNLSISNRRTSLRGSLPNIPAVGQLESALQKVSKTFCNVTVQPKGTSFRSQRVNFTAEIELCE